MNLNQRQLMLLKMMLNTDSYLTTEEYAEKLLVTSRTIKNDIVILRDELKDYGISIYSKRGKGIILIITDSYRFKLLKDEMSKATYNFGGFRSEYHQRAFLIYRMIVNKTDWFTVDDLAESMNLSRSVINHEMPEVRNRLARYGLALEVSTAKGMRLVGPEISIRAAIIDGFENFNEDQSSEYYLDEFGNVNLTKTIEIRKSIIELFKTYGIVSTSILIDRLTIACLVSFVRNQHGRLIDNTLDQFEQSKMMHIVRELNEITGIELPKNEVNFLTMFFLCYSFPKCLHDAEIYYVDYFSKAKTVFEEFVSYLNKKWNIEITRKYDRDNLLIVLLHNLIISKYMLFSMYLTNSIREYSRSSIFFDIAYRCALYLNESFEYIISRSLLYSFVLFFDLLFSEETRIPYEKMRIKIIPNYEFISGEIYRKFIVSRMPQLNNQVLIETNYSNDDNQSVYIVIDNEAITGKNVLHVSYSLEQETFLEELQEKLIELYFAFPESIQLTKENIVVLKKS